MLAFNLSVFFRNLQGEDVAFTARSADCEVRFVGGVESLQERTDFTRHLAVTLHRDTLRLRIGFEEPEDEEADLDQAVVVVRLLQEQEGEEALLVEASFRFGEISLKPTSELQAPDEPPPEGPPDGGLLA